MAAKRKRKGTKMKPGECRTTKNGQDYCMTPDGVKFKKRTGARLGSELSGSKSRRKKKKTCVRFKRVDVKGTTGKQRRCAKFG